MNEVMEKTYELIDYLDNSDVIKNIEIYKNKIENNLEIKNLIDKGNNTDDKYLLMDIKNRLYKNSDYREYISLYNEIMYMVMEINSRFMKITKVSGCGNK